MPTDEADDLSMLFAGVKMSDVYLNRRSYMYKPKGHVLEMDMAAYQAVPWCCLASMADQTTAVIVSGQGTEGEVDTLMFWLVPLLQFDNMRVVHFTDAVTSTSCAKLPTVPTGMDLDSSRILVVFDLVNLMPLLRARLTRQMGGAGFASNIVMVDPKDDDDFADEMKTVEFTSNEEFLSQLEILNDALPLEGKNKEARKAILEPFDNVVHKMRVTELSDRFAKIASNADKAMPYFKKLDAMNMHGDVTKSFSLRDFLLRLRECTVQSTVSAAVAKKNWVSFFKTNFTGDSSAHGFQVVPRVRRPLFLQQQHSPPSAKVCVVFPFLL